MDEQPAEWIPLRQAIVEVAKAYAEFLLCEPAGALETAQEAVLQALKMGRADARASRWVLRFPASEEHPESLQDEKDGVEIPMHFWGVYDNAETVHVEDWVAGYYSFSWDGKTSNERVTNEDSDEIGIYAFGLAIDLHVTRRGLPLLGNQMPTDQTVQFETQRLQKVQGERRGRPAKWDWEAALCAIAAKANTPDGLPTGHGAQAEIGRMLAQWFCDNQNGEPAQSDIGARAAKIMAALNADRK